jgi:Phosphotransferase enzyme family
VNLDELNARHGTQLTFAGDYDGGEFGAQRLLDENGRRWVLKQQPAGLAPQTTAALRPLGYPAPAYLLGGDGYCIQEELPGEPLGGWRVAAPPRILELNELQAGRAVDEDRSWPAAVVDSVFVGGTDYMILATLERHSDEARELLRCCESAVERHASSLTTVGDVVHWDFTGSNILVRGDEVTGVIDWGGTCSGDRLFDLATFLYYARGHAPKLRAYVVDRVGEEGLSVYLAHLVIRQAEWSVRLHGEGAGWEMVRYGLELARGFPL